MHDLHFTDIFRPSPSHDEQVETCWNCPKKVFCTLVTFPEPLQELHVDFSVPGSALEPLQESHISYLSTITSFSVPNADSSKEIFTGISRSFPRDELVSPEDEPPKNASKILPKPPRSSKPEKPPEPFAAFLKPSYPY